MRVSRWTVLTCGGGIAIVGCATAAATNVRTPLGAHLTPSARTGAPVPLRVDPNAHVILSRAANLPPASYSQAQAARGRAVFNETCATCHSTEQLIGQAFVESWNDRRVYDFYALVRSTMPLDDPGGLKDQQYLDVVSYLLEANHAAPGADSLSADTTALRAHKIAVHFP
jgi:mono/diheme cytochrome c family protein